MTNKNPGWAKEYVENEKPIPNEWRSDFYDELVSQDNEYKLALENSIRKHGVRWR